MALLGSILERTRRTFSSSFSTSSRRLKLLVVLGCFSIAVSLYGFLVEVRGLGPLANLLVGVGLLLEAAAVVSYANRQTLAALLRTTSYVVVIFLLIVAVLIVLY